MQGGGILVSGPARYLAGTNESTCYDEGCGQFNMRWAVGTDRSFNGSLCYCEAHFATEDCSRTCRRVMPNDDSKQEGVSLRHHIKRPAGLPCVKHPGNPYSGLLSALSLLRRGCPGGPPFSFFLILHSFFVSFSLSSRGSFDTMSSGNKHSWDVFGKFRTGTFVCLISLWL
ncbi:hypothetical protein FA13DRAFT_357135 [Coprinellus micaceus]|uniref:Uncharacterized protein n=1 Tax=Coprinellus micaceus TaxID=71717 RepID=A0A4Y7TAS8_COPMI|nr:hypothetical protein FA13DRAFT_357135 [Coprinellus micaceus]